MSTASAPSTTAPRPGEAETSSEQLVVFALGDDEYGVPIANVQEIIRYVPPRPIPGSPSHVEGVLNLRGSIIPVINLQQLFGSRGAPSEDATVVVVELSDATVGVVVDEVREVMTIDLAATEPPPAGIGAEGDESIRAVAKLQDRLLVVLDLVGLLESRGRL
jgi:purine-binding chemotaxis protein CheW